MPILTAFPKGNGSTTAIIVPKARLVKMLDA